MSQKLNLSQKNWNLKILFDGSPEQISQAIELEKIKLRQQADLFVGKWVNRQDYLQDPTILVQALDEYENWNRNWGASGKQGFYLALQLALDQDNSELKALESKLQEFSVGIMNDMQFFTHRISQIPVIDQPKFIHHPDLVKYKHFLEKIFQESRHLLSEAEEKIMNLKHFTSHSKWVNMLESFLSKEEREVLVEPNKKKTQNFSQIINLTSHKNKQVRDNAAQVFNQILAKNLDVAENEINAVLYNKKVNDDLRKFPRPDSARHLGDDVDTEMVDELVKAVSEQFDISQRFYALKAKLMGVKRMAYHERNVEYGNLDMEYSWQDSAKLVYDTFLDLDEQFGHIFAQFLDNGQLDVFPKKGKDSGAFCAPARSNLPIYVMLNHTNRLNDVRTLAHEMGHAINFEMMKHENELNYDASLFLAESCSTFMEDFVLQKVIEQAGEEEKLAIMMEKLNSEISTIFRQIAFYNFETELHAQFRQVGYLSKEQIGTIFTKNMISYMGEVVEQSPGSENWWIYVSHFRNFFYVYSYAGGLLVSKYLQNQVKQNHDFIQKVKVYYSTGTSKSPKQILETIGLQVNEAFWSKGLLEIKELLEETEKLAQKLGKI